MSDEPDVGGKTPIVGELAAGEYWWCACGKSKNQPYCDGSHAGTSFEPLQIKIEAKRKIALCNCKHTKKPPYCDGSHSKL